jgi:hypothetical protein
MFATPIPLSNTGTRGPIGQTGCQGTVTLNDSMCTLLINGQIEDRNFRLDAPGVGARQQIMAVTSAGGFPVPPWLPDNSTSTWISPVPTSIAAREYIYIQRFFVTYSIGSRSILAGRWAADHDALMYLNGNLVSTVPYGNNALGHSYSVWHPFTITYGHFIQGLNVLEFRVNNPRLGTTGLRVEYSEAILLPEPAELFTTLSLLACVLWLASRRRTAVAATA